MADCFTNIVTRQSALGDFARLPVEIRQWVWDLIDEALALLASASLRDDILTRLDLTFEISGASWPANESKEKVGIYLYPTEIRVSHQMGELRPLHPAFFDFRSQNQDRLNHFFNLPRYTSVEA